MPNQTVSMAMNVLRRKRAAGGEIFDPKAVAYAAGTHVGPIHSSVAGRTDHLPMGVPQGAYVIPADIISAMGEGNTTAGFRIANDMFGQPFRGQGTAYGAPKTTPYGGKTPYGTGVGEPYGVTNPGKAEGGATSSVPIVAAGGEFVVSPEAVRRHGGGSLDDGHKILDEFVKHYRAKTIKTLQKLPPPKVD